MSKKPIKKVPTPKSKENLIQESVDALDQLKAAIIDFEGIEANLAKDISRLESALYTARNNLADTRSLLNAQREKMSRDVDFLHNLIEESVGACRDIRNAVRSDGIIPNVR